MHMWQCEDWQPQFVVTLVSTVLMRGYDLVYSPRIYTYVAMLGLIASVAWGWLSSYVAMLKVGSALVCG